MSTCVELSRSRTRTEDLVDEQHRDNQGRIVGIRIHRFESAMTLATEDNLRWGRKAYHLEPGEYYVAQVLAVRSGIPYGGYKPLKFFNSPEERDAFITKRINLFWSHRRHANEHSRLGNKAPA